MQDSESPQFEYDPGKSVGNAQKHGIDFERAKLLWFDTRLLIIPSEYEAEIRFLAIGVIDGRHWTAIFTERENRIRIISVRRSRAAERKLYGRNE